MRGLCLSLLCHCLWFGYAPRAAAQFASPPSFERVFDPQAFSGSRIRELFQDQDGFIWIGTHTGLMRYDGYSLRAFIPDPGDSTTISGFDVISIDQDKDGILWFGTEITGLNRYDPETETFTRFIFDFPTSQNYVNTIWDTYHDGEIVWIASRDGLLKLNPKSRQVRRFRTFDTPVTQDEVRANMLRQIRADPFNDQILWYSALSGVYTFQKIDEKVQPHYASDLSVLYPLSDESDGQYMYAGFEWFHNEWILGAYGGGHYHYNPSTAVWKRTFFEDVDPKLPLSFNVVVKYAVLSDSAIAFTGSKAGVYYPQSGRNILFEAPEKSGNIIVHTADGLLLDHDGFLWMGAWDGLKRSTEPLAVSDNAAPMNLYFPEIRIGKDEPMRLKSVRLVQLHPGQKSIQISYALVAPGMTDSVNYRYRLSGLSDWVDAGQNRMANFTNLNYGAYRFEVQAALLSKPEILGSATLDILVDEVFWKKNGFLFMLIVFAVGIVVAITTIYQRRLHQRERQKAEFERKLAQSEMAALRAQLNPHFLFNSLNSIKQFIIKSEPRSATRYLNKFAQLMRLALEHSKHSTIPLSAELEFLELFLELEQLRLEHRFSYSITVDEGVNTGSTSVPPLLIQPYVENAIWHGLIHKTGNGNLDITVTASHGWTEIAIMDDGVGRAKSAELQGTHRTRKSTGLRLGEERFRLMKQMYGEAAAIEIVDLVDVDGTACGTQVIMKIPAINTQHE